MKTGCISTSESRGSLTLSANSISRSGIEQTHKRGSYETEKCVYPEGTFPVRYNDKRQAAVNPYTRTNTTSQYGFSTPGAIR